jgi:hypothetical protein
VFSPLGRILYERKNPAAVVFLFLRTSLSFSMPRRTSILPYTLGLQSLGQRLQGAKNNLKSLDLPKELH